MTLTNARGVCVRVMTHDASLQSMLLPDRTGSVADVVLGYATIEEYLTQPQCFGATVGRFANRLAHGRFTLEGQE